MISMQSSTMTLKTDAFWSHFKIDSSIHAPSASIKSTTAPREVCTAFLEAFSTKTCNSLAPQDTTKSTNWVMVEWAIWCRVRKWVQRTRDFVAPLFFSLSCIPTLCKPCFDMTSKAWLAWVWRLLLSWAFIVSVAFFQFWNGFVTQTPPVCCVAHSAVVCLQTRQKALLMSSSYTSQLNSFSQFFEYSLRSRRLNQLSTSLLGGRFSNIRIGRTVGSFFRMGTSSKERANIHVFCRYLIDPPNLANYQKNYPSVLLTELTAILCLWAADYILRKCWVFYGVKKIWS